MIFKIDAKRGMRRLKDMRERIAGIGGSRGELRPTRVIYGLSKTRGTTLLATLPRGESQRLKAAVAPKIKRAMLAKGGVPEKVAKAYRYWMYRHVELLWKAVRDRGLWGRVSAATRRDKGKPLPRGVSPGIPLESWGVRHTRPAWYAVQKGKRPAGKRRPSYAETEPMMEVTYRGRVMRP